MLTDASTGAPAEARQRRGGPWWMTGAVLMAVACTLESTRVWFLGDDLEGIWRATDPASGSLASLSVHWRPVADLSLQVDRAIGGLDPVWFHLTNVAAHAAVCLLVGLAAVWIPRSILGGPAQRSPWTGSEWWAAVAATALFGVLPSHAEAVVWIAGRGDVLMTLFCLLALLCHLRASDGGSGLVFAASILAFAAALLTKESAIALVGIVAVLGVAGGRDATWPRRLANGARASAPFAAVAAAWIVARRLVIGSFLGGFGDSARRSGVVESGVHWIALVVRSVIPALPRPAWFVLAAVFAVGTAVAAVAARPGGWSLDAGGRRSKSATSATTRCVAVLVACGAIAALPGLTLGVALVSPGGERLTYLTSVFAVLALARVGSAVHGRRPVAATVAMSVVVMLAASWLVAEQQRWVDAGRVTHHVVEQLGQLATDEPAIVMNLPDTVDGIYSTRNAVTPALALFHRWERPELVWQATGQALVTGDEVVVLDEQAAAGGQRWRLSTSAADAAEGVAWTQLFPRLGGGEVERIDVSGISDRSVDITVSPPGGTVVGRASIWWYSGGELRRTATGD